MALPGTNGSTLYTPPNTLTNQVNPTNITTITDTSGSIATLQSNINTAQSTNTNPSRVFIINLKSNTTYLVSNNPLTLGSMMSLSGSNSTIAAAPSCTAPSLIAITNGSTLVSVSGITLNGSNNVVTNGIRALGVSRIHLDNLIVSRTGGDGISISGLGATQFDSEITVTRCNVSGVTNAAGIHVTDTTQLACLDNICSNNATGILLETSGYGILANNTANSNTSAGINLSDTIYCKVANNRCDGNGTNIVVGPSSGDGTNSKLNAIVSNDLRSSATGISLGGYYNAMYDNIFSNNQTPFAASSGTNRIITTSQGLTAPSPQQYFYPPTISNPHTNAPIMNGKGRTDLFLTNNTLSGIQTSYDASYGNNPTNVIVLWIHTNPVTGASITNDIIGDQPLTLHPNTCVVLNGTIKLTNGIQGITTTDTGNNYISISGGTIDGQNFNDPNILRYGIYFTNSYNVLIDHVALQNFGYTGTSTIGGYDEIALFNCSLPTAVGYCSVTNGASRGIWTKACTGALITDNKTSKVNYDGIDIDAFTSTSLVKFNTSTLNVRTGIFMEEGAKYNHVIANNCSTNTGDGINLNTQSAGQSYYNSLIANTCASNARYGFRIAAAFSSGNTLTMSNFIFNNVISNSGTLNFANNSNTMSFDNYCAQLVLYGTNSNSFASAVTLFPTNFPATLVFTNTNSSNTYDGQTKPLSCSVTPTNAGPVILTYGTNGSSSSYSTSPPVNAGNYVVKAMATNGNYSGLAYAYLTIAPISASVTFSNTNPVYNGSGQAVVATVTPTNAGIPLITYSNSFYPTTSNAPTNAGNYTFLATLTNSNYDLTNSDGGTLSITPYPAIVTISNTNQKYTGTALSVTTTVSPTNAGPASVTYSNTNYSLTTSPPVNAGLYSVVATVTNTNYSGYTNGSFLISPATSTVTLGNLSQTYDGSPKPITATTLPTSLAVSITYNGSPSPPSSVGSYPVTGTVTDPNYTGSSSGVLAIADSQANWRNTYFGTPINSGSAADSADPDGDGRNNAQEYAFGSDPNIPDSAPFLTIANSGGSLSLGFLAKLANGAGYGGYSRYYTLEGSSNLKDPSSWSPLSGYSNIFGNNQSVSVTLPISGQKFFYRLRAWLQ